MHCFSQGCVVSYRQLTKKVNMRLFSIGYSVLAAVVVLSCVRAGAEDLVIYGGTSAGVSAALQAKRMGISAVLLEPTGRIGGLTTGGLGQTDIGNKESFGGIAREFYAAVRKWYDDPAHWTRQTFEDYLPDGQCAETKLADTMWTFEPSAALAILEGWERDNGLRIVRHVRLDRGKGGVTVADGRIVSIRTEDGRVWKAKMFIDATYEGDLMAAAGVTYALGREGNAKYGETVDGIERRHAVSHQFFPGVDAYVKPGDRSSGLLPGVEEEDPRADGEGDSRIQAYCFRMCLTDVPENRIPFRKPEGYRELDYELLLRNLEKGITRGPPWINSRMPNRKTDTNNRGGVSTDFIGMNHAYPEASYAEREEIVKAHLRYQQGLMWTLANHPRVPARIRDEVARWGTCRDEFAGERGDGWQNQLYVREARRLVGEYVMTEHECMGARTAPRSVALAAYGMDSHNCRRYVGADGCVRNEGDVEHWTLPDGRRIRPYAIGYGALVPKRGECANLLVPVCVSASHMAFGSIRMEPVFFALGQVAGTAAAQAIAAGCAVQDVDYAALRARLLADGQVVDPPPDPAKAKPCRIEGPSAPKPWEATAVKEFTDYFQRVSAGGKVFVDGEGVVVFHVGDTEFARTKGLLSSSFADEGWCVRSFGHDVVLNGGGTRGCLYAVYNFLEKKCWIRWWNDGDEHVPRGMPLEFPKLDLAGRPSVRYRCVVRPSANGASPDFRTAVRNRLNANGDQDIPLEWGGAAERPADARPVVSDAMTGLGVRRFFLAAHVMEDPTADADYLSDEFMYLYFGGKAYPLVKIALKRVEAARTEAFALLDEALRAPTDDEVERRRARLSALRADLGRELRDWQVKPFGAETFDNKKGN